MRCRRPRQRRSRAATEGAPVLVALGMCALLNASGGIAAESGPDCTTSTSALLVQPSRLAIITCRDDESLVELA